MMIDNGVQCEFSPGYDGTVILERLGHVIDPELDESIVHLGFVHALHVYDGHVVIVVQLPTSWCAANFAYMMADDIRRTLLTVEGIQHVTVRLQDHFAAEAIETAVNAGKPLAEAFPDEGYGSLAALRVTFLRKGFTSRQERFLRALRAAGLSPEDIHTLHIRTILFAFLLFCEMYKPLKFMVFNLRCPSNVGIGPTSTTTPTGSPP